MCLFAFQYVHAWDARRWLRPSDATKKVIKQFSDKQTKTQTHTYRERGSQAEMDRWTVRQRRRDIVRYRLL